MHLLAGNKKVQRWQATSDKLVPLKEQTVHIFFWQWFTISLRNKKKEEKKKICDAYYGEKKHIWTTLSRAVNVLAYVCFNLR